MPAQITGHPCQNQTALISQFLQQGNPESIAAFQAFVTATGVSADKISVGDARCTVTVNGADTNVEYSALRAPGADSNTVLQATIGIAKAQDATQAVNVTQGNVGGKSVSVVTAPDESVTYLYGKGDTVFLITSNTDPAVDAAILSALP